MSEPEATPSPVTAPIAAAAFKAASSGEHFPHVLTIRVWPNIPILYPMAIAALICGICSLMFGLDPEVKRLSSPPVAQSITQPDGTTASIITSDKHEVKYTEYASKLKTDQVIALVFLAALTYTMVVLCTDIMLTWALLGVAAAVILGMGLFIMNIYYNFLGGLFHFLGTFLPTANAHFYFAIFTIWVILMIAAILYSRFHYIRIEANEVIVVGGMLDKRRRFSTLRMTYTKEVFDVFEYYLPFVRSGRLIFRFSGETEPIVVDHVMHLESTVKKLDHITGNLQVIAEQVTVDS